MIFLLMFLKLQPPPRFTLFPYTTLFRSHKVVTCLSSTHQSELQLFYMLCTVLEIVTQLLLLLFQRSEEHTSELQSRRELVCRLLLEKKKKITYDLSPVTIERNPGAPLSS